MGKRTAWRVDVRVGPLYPQDDVDAVHVIRGRTVFKREAADRDAEHEKWARRYSGHVRSIELMIREAGSDHWDVFETVWERGSIVEGEG